MQTTIIVYSNQLCTTCLSHYVSFDRPQHIASYDTNAACHVGAAFSIHNYKTEVLNPREAASLLVQQLCRPT